MIDMLTKLIQADSTAQKGELTAAEVLLEELDGSGIEAKIDKWEQDRANFIAKVRSSRRRGGLLFACHLDVVPAGDGNWLNPAFSGHESDGKIYGRGAADMKGPVAAIVTAIKQIVETSVELQGDIILLAAAGEETDSCGAKRFVRDYAGQLPPLAGVVITEPTDFEIITAHRSLLWLEVSTKGRTAHGSMPQLGVNALTSMNALLNELADYTATSGSGRVTGSASMSINTIVGGKAINVVPDRCTIGIDIRTSHGQGHQKIITDLKKIFSKLKAENPEFDAEVAVARDVEALETDTDSDFIKLFCSAVGNNETTAAGFCTDGPFLVPLSKDIVIFGPGKPHLCHKPDEYIEISDLEKAVDYYKNIILKFLT
jgi:succinyl-diaminopimelate desuccinylase